LFLGAALLMVLGVFTAASFWQAARLGGRGVVAGNTLAQKILLGAQIALSLALVSGATLFGASLRNTYAIDFGIQPRNVWNVVLAPRPAGYRNFAPAPYYRDLLARIEALPGVISASISQDVPFWGVSNLQPVSIIDSVEVQAQVTQIGDRFFETLGAKNPVGEDFRRHGDDSRELSVVISQSLAGKLGGRGDLIGHHLRIGSETKYQHVKIAGIAADVDLSLVNLEDKRPFTVYTNFWQNRDLQRYPVLLVRTATSQFDEGAVRRIVERGGREYVERLTSVTGEIDNALIENRLLAYLAGAFSVLALIIAAVGLFALLSYQVSTRTA